MKEMGLMDTKGLRGGCLFLLGRGEGRRGVECFVVFFIFCGGCLAICAYARIRTSHMYVYVCQGTKTSKLDPLPTIFVQE